MDLRPLSSLAELARRLGGAVGNASSSTLCVGGRCEEVGTGVGDVSSSCVWGAARASSGPTTASAALRKRARGRKYNTASLIGRKAAASPAWKDGPGKGHENGVPGGEGEKRRLTFDDHEWGERKPSHQGKAPEEEQQEHYIFAMAHEKHVRRRGRGAWGGRGKCYSPSGMAMSMTSLLICLDETVSVVGVDSEDLENSWVMTGMAIAVKGMTTTSR